MSQLALDLAPAPEWKPLRLEQARILAALAANDCPVTGWDICAQLVKRLPSYQQGWVASRLSELHRLGLVECVGSVAGPFGRPLRLYAVTASGWSRMGEARGMLG